MIAKPTSSSAVHALLGQKFQSVFSRPAEGAVRAPGRVNLIGEHTDYNDGFVLPIAITRQVSAAYARRTDRTLRLHSTSSGSAVVDLDAMLIPTKGAWSNYPVGVAVELAKAGVKLAGADVLLDSTVPLGAGLSSSAALEVATALALLAASGKTGAVTGRDLALLCQRAENLFAGAPCGIMDQSIAVMGQVGHALLLDCRDGSTRQVPFSDPSLVLLVADTQVKHDIGDGGYPLRRRQCHEAAAKLTVKALRDVTPAQLDKAAAAGTLGGDLLKRAKHVVGEIDRTLQAVKALGVSDYALFGQLMYQSHDSLRDDFQVSCDELDAIVESARASKGVFGARMTGGGFGGSAIVLVEARAADAVAEKIAKDFHARFNRRPPVFPTTAAAGAGALG
jgi:galactokinase